ncbi:DUF4905 domain-containing protein [Mucilaginibacter myungsuensis]|uniref:DUF4905 domain-containing protein n=1 Tax=Mucilaginibacter myungsuensis TaxID=649104 RepID=A0A929KTY6_9SPHI|nr:DUF4905 domain-containing protein [Mucilaginibacter myungsuensis]MBE9660737.1 DUF4905 domain-containing protein [Mucilaginibacter myungsuensis]MDN3600782.1 DUF4905 domain-containing protein [Mucilaginibacter myungsuensis]
MELKPYIKLQLDGIVWRMEIDPVSSTLCLEVRREQDKQVSFTAADLISGKINFTGLTVDERWLTGIESAYDGVLLLHGYASEGSPTHKGLTALDGTTGEILWQDYNRTFDHLSTRGPVCYDTRFQPRKLSFVDIKTGTISGTYDGVLDQDIESRIIVPDMVTANETEHTMLPQQPFANILHKLYHNSYRIVSLHAQKTDALHQLLYIYKDGNLVFTDLLNSDIQKLQPEAFVLHDQHLIYLKNRMELNVIKLEY